MSRYTLHCAAMKEYFEELVDLSRMAVRCDPWVKQAGMRGYCRELKGEVDEVLEAIEKGDVDNLQEELGDLFLDLSRLCALAEDGVGIDTADILADALDKVKRRQPFSMNSARH